MFNKKKIFSALIKYCDKNSCRACMKQTRRKVKWGRTNNETMSPHAEPIQYFNIISGYLKQSKIPSVTSAVYHIGVRYEYCDISWCPFYNVN